MSNCGRCDGDGRIPLLGPNFTTCPDCTDDDSLDMSEWEVGVWFANSYTRLQLEGTVQDPVLSFNPNGGVIIRTYDDDWVASTSNGTRSGKCTDAQALADLLEEDQHFWFQDSRSQSI